MQVQYRQPGFISPLGCTFLDELSTDERFMYEQPLKHFESVCIVSTFEDALLVFPFVVNEESANKLKRIHSYVRQLSIGQLAEELLYKASMDKKDSMEASRLLLEILNSSGSSEKEIERLTMNFKMVDKG